MDGFCAGLSTARLSMGTVGGARGGTIIARELALPRAGFFFALAPAPQEPRKHVKRPRVAPDTGQGASANPGAS